MSAVFGPGSNIPRAASEILALVRERRQPPRDRSGQSLADAVRAGDRRALARAITLVESTPGRPSRRRGRAARRADARHRRRGARRHHRRARRRQVDVHRGARHATRRRRGREARRARGRPVEHAHRRLDPRRQDPHGAARHASRSRSSARRRRAARSAASRAARARRCSCARPPGCDVVIVETVGVGQSEVAVAGMVDLFVLLLAPGAGDELQGVKRGIVELADLLVVNKADGDLEAAARRTAADYANALHIGHAGDEPRRSCSRSALTGDGIPEVWEHRRGRSPDAKASGARRGGEPSRPGRGCGRRCPTRCWSGSAPTPAVATGDRGARGRRRRGRVSRRPRPRGCSARLLASARLGCRSAALRRRGWAAAAQDLAGLGDALAADGAGALVEHPVDACRPPGAAAAGSPASAVRFGLGRHGRLAHTLEYPRRVRQQRSPPICCRSGHTKSANLRPYHGAVPVYLDHAASTPMRPEAIAAMLPFLAEHPGNPSGATARPRHEDGARSSAGDRRRALRRGPGRGRLHRQRERGRQPRGEGRGRAARERGGPRRRRDDAIEHKAVLGAAARLEREGFRVARVGAGADGGSTSTRSRRRSTSAPRSSR